MARRRQYADPISIPFDYATKERIEKLAEEFDLAQADVVRDSVAGGGLDDLEQRLRWAPET